MTADALVARIDALLEYLPAFDDGTGHGFWHSVEREGGVNILPWHEKSETLDRFVTACRDGHWVLNGFNWGAWSSAQRDFDEPTFLRHADIATIEKVLTTVIRQDRFDEGTLARAAESGLLRNILDRLGMIRDSLVVQLPNIFRVMHSVSTRTEPYHSAFLGAMLRWSYQGDRRLFDVFWRLAAPAEWDTPTADVTVMAEDPITSGRVDLVIFDGPTRVLGVEVKTREESTMPGQLARYREGLAAKYPGRQLALVFLTPFDRVRAEDAADSLRSVREFDDFRATFPLVRHISWLDVAEIDCDGGDLWSQHRDYIRTVISSEHARLTWLPSGTSRGFTEFFGAEAAERFDQQLGATAGPVVDYMLDLSSVSDPDGLVASLRILIEASPPAGGGPRSDDFSETSRRPFLESTAGPLHRAIFALATEYSTVWIQGKVDYGLRVAHPRYPSGISLARSRGTKYLEIGRPR
ncbi:MAG: DUF6508 domain-containing protein [Dehalococcoidia bacterium]